MYPTSSSSSSSSVEERARIQDALQQWKDFNAREKAFEQRMKDLERCHDVVVRRDAVLEERRRAEGTARMRARAIQAKAVSIWRRDDVENHDEYEEEDTKLQVRKQEAEMQVKAVESLRTKVTQDIHKQRLEAALVFQFMQERGKALVVARDKIFVTQKDQESRAQALSAKEACIENMVRRGIMAFLSQAQASGDQKHKSKQVEELEMKRYEEALTKREEVVALKEELLDMEMKRREEREGAVRRREMELRGREESFQRRMNDLRLGLMNITPSYRRSIMGKEKMAKTGESK